MDMGEFFFAPKEPSFTVMSEDGRAYYGRRQRVVQLLVPMCCTKCEEQVREIMAEMEGVQGVVVDPTTQRVMVTGFVDPLRTLKKARKVKRDSQLLSGNHLIPSSPKLHHPSVPYRFQPSAYHAPPISSVVHHVQAPSSFHTSYNRHTPSSSVHYPARPSYDEMVITNPHYVKHIEHDGYWYYC